jgi:hypothetical protein
MKNFIFSLFVLTLSLSAKARAPEMLAYASDTAAFPAPIDCYFSNSKFSFIQDELLVPYTCMGGKDIYSEIWKVTPKGSSLIFRSREGNLLKSAYVWKSGIYTIEYGEFRSVSLHEFKNGVKREIKLPGNLAEGHIHDLAPMGDCLWFRYTDRGNGIHSEGCYQDGKFTLKDNSAGVFFHNAHASEKILIQKMQNREGGWLQIRVAPAYIPQMIMEEKGINPKSNISHIRNLIAVNDSQWAVLLTTDKGLALATGTGTTYEIKDLSSQFKEADYWNGDLTSKGEYIMRATEKSGKKALWKVGKTRSTLLITDGDKVSRDGYDFTLNKNHLFMGPPAIDSKDRIHIGVGLDFFDEKAIGQGILKL